MFLKLSLYLLLTLPITQDISLEVISISPGFLKVAPNPTTPQDNFFHQ
jgi:hypothetical protein